MPPVGPARSIVEIIENIWANRERAYNIGCLVKRLRRIDKEMDRSKACPLLEAFGIADGDMGKYAEGLAAALAADFAGKMQLLLNKQFQEFLLHYPRPPRRFYVADDTQDVVSSEWMIDYGKQRGIPWGISESGYNMVDANLNYQYKAFGVPGMGLKRGLADDQVVAPYASFLALMVAPAEACSNLERLASEKMVGKFGLYEAIDFTLSRMPRGQSGVIVKSFMAHHQGMSFLALAYHLLDRPMQKRFESDTFFQATILLLQERIPKVTPFYSYTAGFSEIQKISSNQEMPVRVIKTPDTPIPEVHLLSNGRYNVMVTNAGGGYSCFNYSHGTCKPVV